MAMKAMGIGGRLAAGVGATLLALVRLASAADLDRPALPTFALAAPPGEPSPWTGLYVGTEVFGVAGGKGVRGGFGGGGYAGYDRAFDSDWVVGLRGGVGYSPSVFARATRGFNYADVEARVGYDMGRLMPFVTVGGVAARANGRTLIGYGGPDGALNDFLNSSGETRGFASVGAGFAYRLTSNTTVELAVQATHGNGVVLP